jgi:hypothetical protein
MNRRDPAHRDDLRGRPGIQLQFFRRASKKDEAPCASYARYSLPGRVFDYEQRPNRGYANDG